MNIHNELIKSVNNATWTFETPMWHTVSNMDNNVKRKLQSYHSVVFESIKSSVKDNLRNQIKEYYE